MKQLATKAVEKVTEADGEKITSYLPRIQLRGDEETYSSKEVQFKVLTVRNRLIKWNKQGTKVLGESVYFEMKNFKDAYIPESLGGNAFGRIFPSWEGVKKFDADRQKVEKDKAGWYTYLFGEVTFPGSKPMLVNYRITGPQSVEWGAIEKEIRDNIAGALLKLTAVAHEKNNKFATVEYTILQQGLDTSGNESAIELIEDFVDTENEKVLQAYYAAGGGKPPAPVREAELDDEIPF